MSARPKRRGCGAPPSKVRTTDYRNLRNPFLPMDVFSSDRIAAVNEASLDVLEWLGIKVLLPAARAVFKAGGDIIEAALATAPKSFDLIVGDPGRNLTMELGSMIFQLGAGCPHATDLERGRRPGTEQDFRELITLTQHFDVLHMIPPLVEPQDVPIHLRHYAMTKGQMELTNKVPFVYSRGTGQVEELFEMLQIARGISDVDFAAKSHCYTIINTNSPRQLDVPMALGVMDFARAGQLAIITLFTLMWAMAPITVAGAMTLSHAETMAATSLGQLVNLGAPVCYGTFTSNVDMKSGALIFGTPEHFKAPLAAGQLARHIGLPWRSP